MEKPSLSSTQNKRRKKIWIIFLLIIILVWLPLYLFVIGGGRIKAVSILKTKYSKYCISMSEDICKKSLLCSIKNVPYPCNNDVCPEAFINECRPKF